MTPSIQSRAQTNAVDLALAPIEVIKRWPDDIPGAWLVSSGSHPQSRWSILGIPSGVVERADPWSTALRSDPRRAPPLSIHQESPPFNGGWIGWLAYELGEDIEPAVRRTTPRPADDRRWPPCHLVRCDSALVHDAMTNEWTAAGDPAPAHALARAIARRAPSEHGFRVGRMRSATGRERFERDARCVIGLIHDGDAFQVNLSHRLSGAFAGSARSMFAALASSTAPMFGAHIEHHGPAGEPRGAVCSVSPEMFLRVERGTGRVVTRPMKGTSPTRDGPDRLRESEKDRAELAMIVDLMRNDLGRVCEFATVRVDEPRVIEAHHGPSSGVWQGVATVSGVLRRGVSHADLLRATFPPGSVTGAPKVRAMQIIRELEPVARGPYCGAIGFVSDCGAAAWGVAIRTAALAFEPGATPGHARGSVDFAVGAGIVADSDPRAEWRETLTKAAAFRAAVRVGAPR